MTYTNEQIETAKMLIRFYNLQAGTSFRISYNKNQEIVLRALDAMENARFDRRWWPCKQIVTEKDENGNVKYWHKCTSFILTEGSK